MTPLSPLETILKVKFKDQSRLNQALIHRSYLNENRHQNISSNERYEFLGDAILEFWISSTLFHQFPKYEEGDLTNLRALIVCTQNLATVAKDLNIGNFILLSHGEEANQGRVNPSILADTFESILGAIFLDQGIEACFAFLNHTLTPSITTLSQQKIYKDPKSYFQEIAQSKENTTPHYEIISETGPDHQKTFKTGVYLGARLIASGTGPSKQKAEEAAATAATEIFTQKG